MPLLLLLAFGLGAGTTWLAMRNSSSKPPKSAIESFIPPGGSGPSAQVSPTGAAPAAATPPNVSQLPAADAARTLANWNYDRQDWAHAIEHYEQAIAAGADNADVRTDLGNCYRFLDQPEKALEQYQIAQTQNPQHVNSLFNQVSLFAQVLHDHERAETAAREFIARFPASPQAETARQMIRTPEQKSSNPSPQR
ncbi:MAG: tetratricopeptide repeat protein [Spartobacteria bacterium]